MAVTRRKKGKLFPKPSNADLIGESDEEPDGGATLKSNNCADQQSTSRVPCYRQLESNHRSPTSRRTQSSTINVKLEDWIPTNETDDNETVTSYGPALLAKRIAPPSPSAWLKNLSRKTTKPKQQQIQTRSSRSREQKHRQTTKPDKFFDDRTTSTMTTRNKRRKMDATPSPTPLPEPIRLENEQELKDDAPILKPIVGQPLGLDNLGNTCFMNSVLQSLLHVPSVRSFVQHLYAMIVQLCALEPYNRKTHKILFNWRQGIERTCGNLQRFNARVGALHELVKLLDEIDLQQESPTKTSVSPEKFHTDFCELHTFFGDWHQHDAHEMLSELLDDLGMLSDVCNKLVDTLDDDDTLDRSSVFACPWLGTTTQYKQCNQCMNTATAEASFTCFEIPIRSSAKKRLTDVGASGASESCSTATASTSVSRRGDSDAENESNVDHGSPSDVLWPVRPCIETSRRRAGCDECGSTQAEWNYRCTVTDTPQILICHLMRFRVARKLFTWYPIPRRLPCIHEVCGCERDEYENLAAALKIQNENDDNKDKDYNDLMSDINVEPCMAHGQYYRLVGLLVHRGQSISTGHYVTIVAKCGLEIDQVTSTTIAGTSSKNESTEPIWFLCNDSKVTRATNISTVIDELRTRRTQTPYLLFYERVTKM